jgi:hypothetical protein
VHQREYVRNVEMNAYKEEHEVRKAKHSGKWEQMELPLKWPNPDVGHKEQSKHQKPSAIKDYEEFLQTGKMPKKVINPNASEEINLNDDLWNS